MNATKGKGKRDRLDAIDPNDERIHIWREEYANNDAVRILIEVSAFERRLDMYCRHRDATVVGAESDTVENEDMK